MISIYVYRPGNGKCIYLLNFVEKFAPISCSRGQRGHHLKTLSPSSIFSQCLSFSPMLLRTLKRHVCITLVSPSSWSASNSLKTTNRYLNFGKMAFQLLPVATHKTCHYLKDTSMSVRTDAVTVGSPSSMRFCFHPQAHTVSYKEERK